MAYPYYYPYYSGYQPNQSFAPNNIKSMEWVEGEIGAKSYQQPQGWPAETPIVLWDSTDKKIFIKSWNNVGMANQIQEIDYVIKERPNGNLLPQNTSGDAGNYVTKEDFNQLKQELKNLTEMMKNNNRGGGNR